MTASPDPFEVVRRLRPDDDDGPLEPGVDEGADALLQRIVASTEQPAKRVSRRRGSVLGGLLAAVVIGAGSVVAARWLSQGEPTVIGQITCWGGDTAPPIVQVGVALPDGADPEDLCAEQWRNGLISRAGAPSLVSCITDNGIIAVIPTDEEGCVRLGFPLYQATEEGRAALREYNELHERINVVLDASCVDEASTRALVERVLAENQFSRWTQVDGAAFTPDRPCGFTIIDATARTVTVLGMEAWPAPGGSISTSLPDREEP